MAEGGFTRIKRNREGSARLTLSMEFDLARQRLTKAEYSRSIIVIMSFLFHEVRASGPFDDSESN